MTLKERRKGMSTCGLMEVEEQGQCKQAISKLEGGMVRARE
jgi:hypothetical protein